MKNKLALLLVLVLLAILAMGLIACNPQTPQIITKEPDNTQNATNSVAKQYAWDRIYSGMKAIGTPDNTYINFDTVFHFSYLRNGVGATYYIRAKGSIDIYDDTKSKLAIEVGSENEGEEKLFFGIYYTYSEALAGGLLYADARYLTGGTKVLKVTDVNLSQFAQVLSKVMSKLDIATTIDDLLQTDLLGNSIINWISSVLFGECSIIDNGNGRETVKVTLDITDILDIALGALGSLLSDYQDILVVVRDMFGLDLTNLKALIPAATGSFNVVLNNNVFESMDVTLNVYHPDIKNPSEIDTIQLGVDKLVIGTIPDVQIPEIAEEDLRPFSFTTLSLDLEAYLITSDKTITIAGIEDAFGTLLTSLLASVSNTALATMPISFSQATYKIELNLDAELNLTDNSKTNILLEIYGLGATSTMRAGIYYIGADKTAYIDLCGILGAGARYKVENVDIVEIIMNAINGLVDGIGAEANSTASMTPAQKMGAFVAKYIDTDIEDVENYVTSLITSGQVPQLARFEGSGEATTAAVDFGVLLSSIFNNLEIVKGDGLLSIDRLTLTLSKEVLETIIAMFSDGAKLPIDLINLEYEDSQVTLDVIFGGILEGFSAHVAAKISYGAIDNEPEMRSKLNGVHQTRSTYLNFAQGGGLDIENIFVTMRCELNIFTLSQELTQITYEDIDSPTTMFLQLLLKVVDSNEVNLNLDIEANINIKSFIDSQIHLLISDDEGQTYFDIYFTNKTLYLDASYFGLQKFKVDISGFMAADESSSTAEGEEGGGIDFMAIIAALIGQVNIGTDYLEVLLADRILTQLLEMLDSSIMDKLSIGDEGAFDGGIRISFGDGLNLNEISVFIFASSGSNFDMGVSLSDITISMVGDDIVPPRYILITDPEFAGTRYGYNSQTGLFEAGYGDYQENYYSDFINDPNVWFAISGEMSLNIVPGIIDLSSGLEQLLATIGLTSDMGIGNITMEEQINETFNIRFEANLDLEPLINKLQNKTYTTVGNETQLLLTITREVEGEEDETLLGIYYKGGILYLDIASLGIEKVAIEFDLFELIMGLFTNEESEEASGTDFRTSFMNSNGELENYSIALLLSLAMSDENIVLSIADGLTQLVLNQIGFGFPEIIAELELRWRDSEDTDIEGNPIYEAGLYLYGAILDDQGDEKISLRLSVDQPDIAFESRNISKTVFGPEYTLIKLTDEDGNIAVPGVYFEMTGYISASAFNNDIGENNWEVGTWLESIVNFDNAGLNNLLKQLLFSFDIHSQIESTIGFKISLMLRLNNENANINDPNFSIGSLLDFDYILTHSDLAVEIWDGIVGSEVSEKVISLYLLYEGENAFGVPYSTLYLDVDTTLVSDVHVKVEGFSLAALLGMLEEDYAAVIEKSTLDTSAEWTPFDTIEGDAPVFVSSNPLVATVGNYVNGVLTINLLGVEGETIITATKGDQVVRARVVVAPLQQPAEEPEEEITQEEKSALSMIATIISGGISSITMNNDGVVINLGAKLVGVILGLFLPNIYYEDEAGNIVMVEMVELNPERSFINLNWTTKELVASLGVDPVAVKMGIDGVSIALYDKGVADIEPRDYINITELTQFSLALDIEVEFLLKESGLDPIQIDDYLKAFIANFALDFGLDITDDIYAGLSLEIEANLNLNNIAGTELFLQLVNNNTGDVLIGMYLLGDKLYINMGMLSEQNVVINDISVAQIVTDALNGLVNKVTTGVTEATGTTDGDGGQERALQLIFAFAKNEISLTLTQNLIIAIINYLVNNGKPVEEQIDLDSIFNGDNAIADLGMSLNVNLNTVLPSLEVSFDSSLIKLSLAIVKPYFTTALNPERYMVKDGSVTGAEWNGLYIVYNEAYIEIKEINRYTKVGDNYIADILGNYVLVATAPDFYVALDTGTVKYVKERTTSEKIAEALEGISFNNLDNQPNLHFNVDLYFDYSLDATYVLMTEEEAALMPAAYRYTKRESDGYFVQNNLGMYKKMPTEFQSLLDAVLGLEAFKDLQGTVIKKGTQIEDEVTIGDLLERLALELYIDDPIANSIKISLFGNVNLEKLGLMALLSGEGSLKDINLSLDNLLSALELGLTMTIGKGSSQKQIQVSLIDRLVYIDLSDIAGPRIRLDLFNLLGSNDEEATSTDGTAENSMVANVLNAIIKVAIIKAKTVAGGIYNEFDSFDVHFNSDMLASLLALFTTDTTFDLSRYALDEDASGLFVKFADERYNGPSISLVLRSLEGLEVKVTMASGLSVDLGSTTAVLTENEKRLYADLTSFKTQTYNFSINGYIYNGATDAATYDLSGLFASWFGDMLFELKSEGEYNDSVAFRLGANVNLADIYLEFLTGKDVFAPIEENENWTGDRFRYDLATKSYVPDANGGYKQTQRKPTFAEFIENSKLDTLEIALELLDMTGQNEIKLDIDGNPVVLGGIYLHGGALYLDGSTIFENAPISYVPNVFEILKSLLSPAVEEGQDEEAVGTADGAVEIDEGNDAVLALIFSDPSIKLSLTKSFIAILLGTLVPDLGSIDDIFDTLSIDLSFNKGMVTYEPIDLSKIWEGDRYSHYYENPAGTFGYINGLFAAVDGTYSGTRYSYDGDNFYLNENGEYKVSESENYELLDFSEVYVGDKYNYGYTQSSTGAYLKIEETYYKLSNFSRFDDIEGTKPNVNGNYVLIAGQIIEILPANRYNLGFVLVPAGEDGEYKKGAFGEYIKLYKGIDGYESNYTGDRFAYGYFADVNGGYVLVGLDSYFPIPTGRYIKNGDDTYTLSTEGTYAYIVAIQSYVEITPEVRYGFGYYAAPGGAYKRGEAAYAMILPYNERYAEVVSYSLSPYGLYKKVGESYVLIGEEETYEGDKYNQFKNYFVNPVNLYDAQYSFMRFSKKFYQIDEYGITLNLNAGVFNMGFGLGGLKLGFGSISQMTPQRVLDEAVPFFESTINIATTVDLKLSMTAGTIDMGALFYELFGDLDGLVIEIPEYGLGETAMHLRAKVDLKLDLSTLANSELSLELFQVTSFGYEDLWIGLYYQGDVLYIDASKLGLPKLSISDNNFAAQLEDMLGRYLGRGIDIGDPIEAGGTADEIDYDTAASLLLGSHKFTITIGEDLVFYVLKLIKIGETPLYDLVYGGLEASGTIELKIDIMDLNATDFNFNLALKLASGDDYVKMSAAELNQADPQAVDYVLPSLRFKFVADTSGLFKYDDVALAFVKLKSTQFVDASLRFSPVKFGSDPDDTNIANYTYKLIPGDKANFDNYEKELLLNLHIFRCKIAFDLEHEFALSPEEIAQFLEYKEIEHITIEERFELTTLFEEGSLDLTEWVHLFFSDEELSDLEGLINVDANGDGDFDDEGEILSRSVYVDFKIDIKFAAIVNLLRRQALTGSTITNEQILSWIEGDLDFGALFDLFTNSDFDFAELVSYINGAIVITMETPENGLETVMGVYLKGGSYLRVENYVIAEPEYTGQRYVVDVNEDSGYRMDDGGQYKAVLDTARLNAIPASERYSHYFENPNGSYVYENGEYVLRTTQTGTRYSYDGVNFYKNTRGEYQRHGGGIFVDMTYFGIPYLTIDSDDIRTIFANLTAGSDENVETDEPEEEEPEVAAPITFPLLSAEVTEIIKMFIWGFQVTSNYVSLVLQASYLNAIADLVTQEDTNFAFYFDFNNRSTVRINTNKTKFNFEAIVEPEKLSDVEVAKYVLTEGLDGSYVNYGGYVVLKGSLTEEQLEDIVGLPFDILKVGQDYIVANPGLTYYELFIFDDQNVALIDILVYLFNHKLNISLSFPQIGFVQYDYVSDGIVDAPISARYDRTPFYGEDDGSMSVADSEYHLFVGENVYVIEDSLRYSDPLGTLPNPDGDYLKVSSDAYVSISANTVKRVLTYYYSQSAEGGFIRKTKNIADMSQPKFKEDELGQYMLNEVTNRFDEITEPFFGTRYSLIDYKNLKDLNKISVTLEGAINVNGAYSETPLNDVLFGLVGDLSSLLTVGKDGENFNLEIGFALALNLDFNFDFTALGTGVPLNEIFSINRVELAFDLWRVEEDSSITNIAGIYYYNGNLFVDLSFMLGDGGLLSIDVGENAIEDLVNSFLAPSDSAEEAGTTEILQGANRAIAGIYVNIMRNNLAMNMSTAMLNLLLNKLMGEGKADGIFKMLPNIKPYISLKLNPLSISIGTKLFNEGGTKELLDVDLTLYGFDSRSKLVLCEVGDSLPNIYTAKNPQNDMTQSVVRDAFRKIATVNIDALLGNSNEEAFTLNLETIKLQASLTLEASVLAGIVNWSDEFGDMLGQEVSALLKALATNGQDGLDADANIDIDLTAFINVENFLDEGKTLLEKLAGTEIKLSMLVNSTVLPWANDPYAPQDIVVIVIIKFNDNGTLSVYLDLDDLGNKLGLGNAFTKLKFENINIGSLFSSEENVEALASEALVAEDIVYGEIDEETATGVLPLNFYNILNSIVREMQFYGNKIALNFRNNMIDSLLAMLTKNDTLKSMVKFPQFDKTEFAIDFTEGLGLVLDFSFEVAEGAEYVLIDEYYPEWQGEKYVYDALGETYTLDAAGTFMKPSDINIGMSLGDVQLEFNAVDSGITVTPEDYIDLDNVQLNLALEGSLSMHASSYTSDNMQNIIDLSGMFEILFGGTSSLASTDLDLRINNTIDIEYNIGLYAYLDLKDFSTAELALTVKESLEGGGEKTVICAYLKPNFSGQTYLGHDIYIDLFVMLGDSGKISIKNFDLKSLLDGLLGDAIDTVSGEAGTASLSTAAGLINSLLPSVFIALRPEYFALAINAKAINAILKFFQKSRGETEREVFPDIGDLLIELYAAEDDKMDLALNLKINDSFYGSLDLTELSVTNTADTGIYGRTGHLPAQSVLNQFTAAYDISSGDVLLESVGLQFTGSLAITSTGLKVGDAGYTDTINYWLGGLLNDLLGGTGTANDFGITLPNGDITFNLVAKIDLNLMAILNGAGLGGILFSDIAIEIYFGAPINSLALGIYYLGSSRVSNSKTSNVYKVTNLTGTFADFIYIDASSLGLGKLKLSGIAGLLGGVGKEAAAPASDAKKSEGLDVTTVESIAAEIIVEENKLAVNFNGAVVTRLLGLLGVDLGENELPIQSMQLDIEFDDGLNAIILNATLDSKGTALYMSLENLEVSFNASGENKLVDVESIVNQTSYGYAGLALGTTGVGGLLANLLESLDPNMKLMINKYTRYSYALTGNSSWGVKQSINAGANGAPTLTIALSRGSVSIDGGTAQQRLALALTVNHPMRADSSYYGDAGELYTLGGTIFNGNIVLTGLKGVVGTIWPGIDVASVAGLDPLDLGGMLAKDKGGQLLDYYSLAKGDNDYYNYPTTGDIGGTYSKNKIPDPASLYNWKPDTTNIIKGININLWNNIGNTYKPYKDGTTTYTAGPVTQRYSTLKLTLNKDCWNDIVCFIPYMLISKMGEGIAQQLRNIVGSGPNTVEGILRPFELLTTFQARQDYMRPYSNALGVGLLRNVIAGSGYDWAAGLVGSRIAGISLVFDALLPLPFATIDPTVLIYIDSMASGATGDISSAPGIQSIEVYVNATATTISNSNEYMRLVIQPNVNTERMITLLEVESISAASGEITPPTSITITDPAQRKGTMTGGGAGTKTMYLTAEYLTDPKLFPQRANVTFLDGTTNNKGSGGLNDLGGVHINWDASSVNMTAANAANNWLAGYAYGYVMGKVTHKVPVYVTNAYEVTAIKGYYNDGFNNWTAKALTVDINKNSPTFNLDLPDEVRITFRAGGTKTFTTHFNDEDYLTNYLPNVWGYIPPATETSDSNATAQFPAGYLEWNYKDFEYDLVGGTVKVFYTYQWGRSQTSKNFVIVPIKNYKIASITRFENGSVSMSNFSSMNAFELNAVMSGTQPADFNLLNFVSSFNSASGKYANYDLNGTLIAGSSYGGLDIKWDLTNLEKAMAKIRNIETGGWDYYKGIDVTVKAFVGGASFVVGEYYKNYPKEKDLSNYVYYDEAKGYVYIRQPIDVKIKIASRVFDSFVREKIKFDPYSFENLTDAGAIDRELQVNFDIDGKIVSKWVKDGVDMQMTIPEVNPALISYKGYGGDNDLFATLKIGTVSSGIQTVKLPIEIRTMTGATKNIAITDTFNPTWFENYPTVDIMFADGITHTMVMDWSTLRIFSRPIYTSQYELKGDNANIYSGGVKYALAEATIFKGDKELGLYEGTKQRFRFMLNVRTKRINEIRFYDGTGDINNAANYNSTTYKLDPYAYDLNPDAYLSATGYGVAGARVLIGYVYNGVQTYELAYVLNWDHSQVDPTYEGEIAPAIATIGNQNIPISVQIEDKTVESFVMDGSYVWNAQNSRYEYNPLTAFSISNCASSLTFADGTTANNVAIEWNDDTKPTTAELNSGTFTRTIVFFADSDIMRQEAEIQIKVIVYSPLFEVRTPIIEGGILPYYMFGELSLPGSVSIEDQLGNEYSGVPLTWNSYELPTAQEMLAGQFTRSASIICDRFDPIVKSFTIYSGYTIKELTKVNGEYNYVLTSANFYRGLPSTLTAVVNGREFPVQAEWVDVAYGSAGLAKTAVYLKLSANGFATTTPLNLADRNALSDALVFLTVQPAIINEFLNNSDFVLDPFGIYNGSDKLFASGSDVTVKIGGEYSNGVLVNYELLNVKATYQLPSDILNSSSYYGKTITVPVTFDYFNGKVVKDMRVRIVDRSVKRIVNPLYRSVVIDPYDTLTFDALPEYLNAITNASGDSFSFKVTWPDNSLIKSDGGSYPDYMAKFEFSIAGGTAVQYVNIPVTIINRTVIKTEFVMNGGYVNSGTLEKKLTTVETHTSIASSQIIETVYDKETGKPIRMTFKNPFSYSADELPRQVVLTFASGERRSYNLTWKFAPTTIASSTETTHSTAVAQIWGTLDSDEPIGNLDIELSISAFKITRYNSDIASDTVDNNFRYNFHPYAALEGTVVNYTLAGGTIVQRTLLNAFNDNNYRNNTTLYIDGKWVLISKLNEYSGYTRLTDGGQMVKYTFDFATRSYLKSETGEYAFVYTTTYNLNVDYITADLTYTYEGGTRYVSAKIGAGDLMQTLRVPVMLEKQQLMQITFDATCFDSSSTAATRSYLLENKTFDPWTSAYDYLGEDFLKFYPTTGFAKFTSDEGLSSWTQSVDITWNVESIASDYRGGVFSAKAIINGKGEYNFLDCSPKSQTFIKSVTYIDRECALSESGLQNQTIRNMTGYVGLNGSSTTWIDPYNYTTPKMPDGAYFTVSDGLGGTATNYFSTTGTTYKLKWDYNAFRPNYTGGTTKIFAVLTVGNSVQRLPVEFNVKRKYISIVRGVVDGVTASGSSVNTGTTGNYYGVFNTVSGLGSVTSTSLYTYYMRPFTPATYKLPTAYNVTFKTWTYNEATGFTSVTDEVKTFSYATVTMPSSFNYNWQAVSQANAYNFTIKFDSQQYVTVPVAVYGASMTSPVAPTVVNGANASISTKTNVSLTIDGTTTTVSVPIVWYGVAIVYNRAGTSVITSHKVSFSSTNATMLMPVAGGRKVVYVLRGVVGVMTDKNSTILTDKVALADIKATYESVEYTLINAGNIIPRGAYSSSDYTYTATVTSNR